MTKAPPVPPQNQSPKGTGDPKDGQGTHPGTQSTRGKVKPANPQEQGRTGNIAQNTTNQGYQQDR
ncbi:MAG TPA: hypothetical protein VKX28_12200 [Xanthobacteraceae bacterium]|jgi:hypothetical protein|nr:hypothetical protein [Xanthobacteraceae bacterium]